MHIISTIRGYRKDIINRLAAYGIKAELKSIYSDINDLIDYGMDIRGNQIGRTYFYRVIKRDFDFEELEFIIDCVISSKTLTNERLLEFIKKIKKLTSIYKSSKLSYTNKIS